MSWKLTVRARARVQKQRYDSLEQALDALEAQARALQGEAPGEAVEGRVKRFEASERVHARLEVAGPERLLPRVRGGVDVHEDGSTVAFVGHVRRTALEPERGQSPYEALRRALSSA